MRKVAHVGTSTSRPVRKQRESVLMAFDLLRHPSLTESPVVWLWQRGLDLRMRVLYPVPHLIEVRVS
jgi:hypothetical protein